MVTAIVLAAGLSARMGKYNKLLLPFAAQTVIEVVIKNLLAAGIPEIIVVTGHEADAVKNVLVNLPVHIIYNPNFAQGMTTSIQSGVSMAKGTGYMICLSDMPLITADDYALIHGSFLKQKMVNEKCIAVPHFKNERGNPVVFSSFYKQAILQHPNMEGCIEIMQSNKENIFPVEVGNKNVLKDMDTFSAYEELKGFKHVD